MTLPTREQLIAEVDKAFFDQHHDAPKRLDPDDPGQAHFVAAWNQLFTEHVNHWTDQVFYQFYANAPRPLDPHNPEHATLVEFWTDIRDTIHHGTVQKYDWNGTPPTADTGATSLDPSSQTDASKMPELHPYQSGEYVSYLQRLLRHHGNWDGSLDGQFDDALLQAVQKLQMLYAINPADGVVRTSTWALLMENTTLPQTSEASQPPQKPNTDDHATAHGTHADPTEVPASRMVDGLPAFQYNLPSVPFAEAEYDTPAAHIKLEVIFNGAVLVVFPHGATDPVTVITTINDQTWRLAAIHAVGGMADGVIVNGIGTNTPSLSAFYRSDYLFTEIRYTPPFTMSFFGEGRFAYQVHTDVGMANVTSIGGVGYQLNITVIPHFPPPEPEPVGEEGWFEHWGPLIVGAAVTTLVVVGAVLAAPETGGGSLLLIEEAGAAGTAAAAAL